MKKTAKTPAKNTIQGWCSHEASAAYASAKADVLAQLKRIQDALENDSWCDDHNGNWGHVGSMTYLAEKVTEAADHINGTSK